MQSKTILIVGLGNPGEQYTNTPHNAGFLVVDQIITGYGLRVTGYPKLKSEIAETKIANRKIILGKPQIFMNKSGEAVLRVTKSYKLKTQSSLWVIHDDIDLELGQIKIVKNRGSAGHKGVENIMQKLKTQDFVRFRIGTRTSRTPTHRPKTIMNKLVVARLAGKDAKIFKNSIEKCKEAVLIALKKSVEKAANIYNKKVA